MKFFYLSFAILVLSPYSYSLDSEMWGSAIDSLYLYCESHNWYQTYDERDVLADTIPYPLKKNISFKFLYHFDKLYPSINQVERTVYYSFIIAMCLILLQPI